MSQSRHLSTAEKVLRRSDPSRVRRVRTAKTQKREQRDRVWMRDLRHP